MRHIAAPIQARLPRRRTATSALCAALALPLSTQASDDAAALSLEQLLDVAVVGAAKYEQKQSHVAAAVSVITRQEIKAFGWRTLAEALASLPGVYTTYDRQYAYLGTRGFSVPGDFNTRVLLAINGNRVNDAIYDQAYAGRDFPLDLELVERIEYVAGPGGAVYGPNAMFGVVNVITRSGRGLSGAEFSVAAQHPQQLREGRASWGGSIGSGADLLLSVSGLRARGEDRFFDFGDAGVAGVATRLDGERDKEFLARVSGADWSFDLVAGDRRKDDPTGVYLADPLASGGHQRDRMLLSQLQMNRRVDDDRLELSGRVFMGRERYDAPATFGGNRTAQIVASDWYGVELRALSTAWAGHKLMLGVEAQRMRVRTRPSTTSSRRRASSTSRSRATAGASASTRRTNGRSPPRWSRRSACVSIATTRPVPRRARAWA